MIGLIKADAAGKEIAISQPIYQYDKGVKLQITGIEVVDRITVDFCLNSSTGICKTVEPDSIKENVITVTIPEKFLESGSEMLYAFVYQSNDKGAGCTMCRVDIPMQRRPQAI